MLGRRYGCYLIMWNFKAWKTYWTFLDLYELDKRKNFIIANIPYKKVDLFFATPEDLFCIFDDLDIWIKDTNSDLSSYDEKKYKNIHLVVDEAQLYFDARKWNKADLLDRLKIFLSQCRKRNISVYFITQRTALIDKTIRRYADFVIRYKRVKFLLLWIQRCFKSLYENEADISDINGEDWQNVYVSTEKSWITKKLEPKPLFSSFFMPLFELFWVFKIWKWFSTPVQRELWEEEYLSKYISSFPDVNASNALNFDDLIVEERVEEYSERDLKIRAWLSPKVHKLKNFYLSLKNYDLKWLYNRFKTRGFGSFFS